ncbi:hypothetical protein IQ07DRAFT_262575 [Pyrenochaeta sp. DS3sAY3a]|nr:hypothetical protein IQ07DRAFT_262575 [Pyrenochaeta sp. DS3sAY3a]
MPALVMTRHHCPYQSVPVPRRLAASQTFPKFLIPRPTLGPLPISTNETSSPEPMALEPQVIEAPSQILITEQLARAQNSHGPGGPVPMQPLVIEPAVIEVSIAGPSIMERSYRVSSRRRWSLGQGLPVVPQSLLRAFSPSPC